MDSGIDFDTDTDSDSDTGFDIDFDCRYLREFRMRSKTFPRRLNFFRSVCKT